MTDLKGLSASEINSMLGNQPYVIKIEHEDAKVHVDYGDGRKTYKSTGVMVFKDSYEQWYAFIGGDATGSNRPYLNLADVRNLINIFGDDFIEYKDIPKEEV